MLLATGLLLASSTTLSLTDALALADRAPDVSVARAESDTARRRVDLTKTPAAPVLTLGTTRYSAREEVAVSEVVRWGGERHYDVLAAGGRAREADERTRRTLLTARRLVRQAWFELAAAEDSERLARETVTRAVELLDSVHARFEGGRVPRLDVVRTSAALARVRAEADAKAEERRGAWAHLAILVGQDPRAEGATDASRPRAPSAEELRRLAGVPAAGHPAVREAASAVDAATAAREAARRRRLPGLELTGGVNADDPGLPGPDWHGSVAFTIPVGGERSAPAVRVADAELVAASARLEAARRDLLEETEKALFTALAALARLRAYDAEALPAADETARLTREAYELGRGDIFRVVESERTLLESRAARLEAYRDLKLAEADLISASGEGEGVDEK